MGRIENRVLASFSAAKSYQRCPRSWWIGAHLAWGGWLTRVPETVKLAYACGKVRSVPAVAGSAIHQIAARSITGVEYTVDSGVAEVRAALRSAYQAAKSNAWRLSPKKTPGLEEVVYGESEVVDATAADTLDRARTLVAALLAHPLRLQLVEERARSRESVRVEERLEVSVSGVPWLFVADVLWMRADGTCEVIDWKTGARRRDDKSQLALYAGLVELLLAVPAVGRVVYLDGEEPEAVDALSPAEVRSYCDEMFGPILERLDDPRFRFASPSKFPRVDELSTCARCELFAACRGTFDRSSLDFAEQWSFLTEEGAEWARRL